MYLFLCLLLTIFSAAESKERFSIGIPEQKNEKNQWRNIKGEQSFKHFYDTPRKVDERGMLNEDLCDCKNSFRDHLR